MCKQIFFVRKRRNFIIEIVSCFINHKFQWTFWKIGVFFGKTVFKAKIKFLNWNFSYPFMDWQRKVIFKELKNFVNRKEEENCPWTYFNLNFWTSFLKNMEKIRRNLIKWLRNLKIKLFNIERRYFVSKENEKKKIRDEI